MKKLKSESGQVEVIEASLIFPLLILLLVLILLKTLNLSLKAKSTFESSKKIIEKGNFFEFTGKNYIENSKIRINPYRYIFFSSEINRRDMLAGNNRERTNISSNKDDKKFRLLNLGLIEKQDFYKNYFDKYEREHIYSFHKIIDIDEFIRICDLSNILIENLLGDKIDEIKVKIKNFSNFKSQRGLN